MSTPLDSVSIANYGLGNDTLQQYLMMQQYADTLAAAQKANAVGTTTSTTTASTPSFKGAIARAPEEEKSSALPAVLLTAGVLTVGAAALCFTKGKALGAEGFWNKITTGGKEYGKSIKNFFSDGSKKAASEAVEGATPAPRSVSNLLTGHSNLQEFTIQQGANQYVMRGGKPVRIITSNNSVIDKADDVTAWLAKNPSAESKITKALDKLKNSGVLPSGMSLSYTKEITDGAKKVYRVTVENGKVVKVMSKDSAGTYHEVKDLSAFMKNHGAVVKEAKTLTQTLSGQKVQILNKKGELVEQTGKLNISTRDGEIVAAKFNGKDLKPEELEALKKSYNPSKINDLVRKAGDHYEGLQGFEYVYRQKGGQVFRFGGDGKPTSIITSSEQVLTKEKAIQKFLDENAGIKEELNKIVSEGSIANGYNLRNAIYKTKAGNLCRINGKNLESIILTKDVTIKGKTFKAGEEISGKYLKEWQKDATNSQDIEKILELLK